MCVDNMNNTWNILSNKGYRKENETLSFDLRGAFYITFTSSFGPCFMFNIDIRHYIYNSIFTKDMIRPH